MSLRRTLLLEDTVSIARPVRGSLRIIPNGNWADDTGIRRPLAYSSFCFYRRWADDAMLGRRIVDLLAQGDYQLLVTQRGFACDYGVPPSQSWDVSQSMALEAGIESAKYLQQIGLGLISSCATRFTDTATALAFARSFCQGLIDAGCAAVLKLWICRNEPSANNYYDYTEADYLAYCEQEMALVRSLIPGVLCSAGSWVDSDAPRGSSDFLDYHSSEHGTVGLHRLSGVQWSRLNGARPAMTGDVNCERRGYNLGIAQDVWNPEPDLDWLVGNHLMDAFAPTLPVLFHGNSVFGCGGSPGRMPTDLPDFALIPSIYAQVPEDLGTWPYHPGGGIVWRYKDNLMATVTANSWDYAAPVPAKHWTVIGVDGVKENDGPTPVIADGWQARMLIAEAV
jgi:hypothetical protein